MITFKEVQQVTDNTMGNDLVSLLVCSEAIGELT